MFSFSLVAWVDPAGYVPNSASYDLPTFKCLRIEGGGQEWEGMINRGPGKSFVLIIREEKDQVHSIRDVFSLVHLTFLDYSVVLEKKGQNKV